MLRILFIGDIVGRPGRSFVVESVPRLRSEWALDFVVANGENAAGGAGINGSIARSLAAAGVDAVTLGDHVWDQKGFSDEIDGLAGVCRPANLAPACPGKSHLILERNGFRLAVFSVLGRQFMAPRDCPFAAADRLVEEMKGRADGILVEIHAEATSEKIALGWHLDGRVGAVVGTHTHVPTADARVLPKGTAYVSDAGMTGPYESVLGRQIAPVVEKFLDGMPRRFEVAHGDVRIAGVLIALDPATGLASSIELVTVRREESSSQAMA